MPFHAGCIVAGCVSSRPFDEGDCCPTEAQVDGGREGRSCIFLSFSLCISNITPQSLSVFGSSHCQLSIRSPQRCRCAFRAFVTAGSSRCSAHHVEVMQLCRSPFRSVSDTTLHSIRRVDRCLAGESLSVSPVCCECPLTRAPTGESMHLPTPAHERRTGAPKAGGS